MVDERRAGGRFHVKKFLVAGVIRLWNLEALVLYFAADEAGAVERRLSHGSTGLVLPLFGIFFSADLYAF